MQMINLQRNWVRWTLRYAVFVFGLYLLTLGVVMIVRTSLGTSPISSFSYVVSLFTPLTLGMATFGLNVLLIIGQLWFIRGMGTRQDLVEILLQIPFSVLFGAFLDLNMYLMGDFAPDGYVAALMLLVAGCVVQAMGVALEMKPNVVTMSGEGFVKYASRRYGRDFGKTKVVVDITLVCIGVVASLLFCGAVVGVREGTIVAACSVGLLVNIINTKWISRISFRKIINRIA